MEEALKVVFDELIEMTLIVKLVAKELQKTQEELELLERRFNDLENEIMGYDP